MKKLICLLVCLFLLQPGAALGEEFSYMSIFDSDFDGWYPRSSGQADLKISDGSLLINGRTADWHSPGHDFTLIPGQVYNISVEVRQTGQPSAAMMISIAHTKDGRESYENLVRQDVRQGEWTLLSAAYTAGQFDRNVLYVETLGSPALDFQIRGFKVLSGKIEYARELPSLKALYADYFDFGCAVTGSEALNTGLMDFYAGQFGIMTNGNELKPDFVLDVKASALLSMNDPAALAVSLSAAEPMLDYAWKNGIKVHGHVLVWHNQTPEAFFRENYSQTGPYVSREVMLGRLENYIRLVFEATESRYPGLIVSWDVVNEAIDDATGKLRQSNWTKVVGEDFISQAFKFARQYAPDHVALYYNDYSTPYQPKLDGILALLTGLKADGTVDGHGFQCHYHLHTPTMAQLQSAMDKVIALGLRLRMSEMDILVDAATDENFEKQARRYGEILALFREYKDYIDAVHTWGVRDNLSWKASQFPLLFDGFGQPKPAFFAIAEPLY